MFRSIYAKYSVWRRSCRTYKKLMELSNDRLEDIGISRSDIPAIAASLPHKISLKREVSPSFAHVGTLAYVGTGLGIYLCPSPENGG